MNSKPEILAAYEDGDEDDFAVVYSRLTGVFRSNAPFTVVFPLADQLLHKIPPESLEAYRSLSKLSCYKTGGNLSSTWLEEGMLLLEKATEEQYRVRDTETNTETIRRESTIFRQRIADAAMERYLRMNDLTCVSDEEVRSQIDSAKADAIRAERVKWEKIKEDRNQNALREKENLKRQDSKDYPENEKGGMAYWGFLIGGTAIVWAAIAIAKGYRYI